MLQYQICFNFLNSTNRYRTGGDPMDTDSDDEPEVEFYPDDMD